MPIWHFKEGNDGIKVYLKLNKATGIRHDLCVADVFMAVVDFMNGEKPKSWWEFTSRRKNLFLGSL